MRDTAGSSRRHPVFRPSLILWLLLFLAPATGMFLLLSRAGGRWLDRGAMHCHGAAIFPGLTVETSPRDVSTGRGANPHSRLIITSIQSNSPAIRRGIAVGDTVVAIDGARIFSLDQARRSLQKGRTATVALRIAHGGQLRNVRLVRGKRDQEGDRHGPQAARHRG